MAGSEYPLPRRTHQGEARAAALIRYGEHAATPTSLVGYTSSGRVLIVGPGEAARSAAERLLDAGLSLTLLITSQPAPAPDAGGEVREIHAPLAAIRGHLGAFEVDITADGEVRLLAPSILTANQPFDLVLDLGSKPDIAAEVAPPGYYPCGADAQALDAAVAQLPDMVGEFEKPRYFAYDPDICAHGARGLSGCTRCLDACPTDAITSLKERIQVDPHLCQGGGSCATACPTGAISYAYPSPADQVQRIRLMLTAFAEAGGERACVLFHDGEAGGQWLQAHAATLSEQVLPAAVEEVGSVGMQVWLSCLAFGAGAVRLLCHSTTPASVRAELVTQISIADAMLRGLGYGIGRIALAEAEHGGALPGGDLPPCSDTPAAFAGVQDKRAALRLAIDHLYAAAADPPSALALPAASPFGEIQVNRDTCTLCFACASVCPAGAVLAGGERPELIFVEQNCVQCGLCATACPEQAVSLHPRIAFDRESRTRRRVMMEDSPFHCVECGKAFGTTRTIESMLSRLAGHWMYRDKPVQLNRLKMCEDCRVKDMLKDGGGLLDPHTDR